MSINDRILAQYDNEVEQKASTQLAESQAAVSRNLKKCVMLKKQCHDKLRNLGFPTRALKILKGIDGQRVAAWGLRYEHYDGYDTMTLGPDDLYLNADGELVCTIPVRSNTGDYCYEVTPLHKIIDTYSPASVRNFDQLSKARQWLYRETYMDSVVGALEHHLHAND